MDIGSREFAKRLNSCLDSFDAPQAPRERAKILSKLLCISRQEAWSLIDGHILPDEELLTRISEEFDVKSKWLTKGA